MSRVSSNEQREWNLARDRDRSGAAEDQSPWAESGDFIPGTELYVSHEVQWMMRAWSLFLSARIRTAPHPPHLYSTVGFWSFSTGGALVTAAGTSGAGTALRVFCGRADIAQRFNGLVAYTPLSRSDRVLRFVLLRQRFVHRCHGRKMPQPFDGRGKLAERLEVEFGPFRSAAFRSAASRWAEMLLAYKV